MLPDRVSNPGHLTYESGALPINIKVLLIFLIKFQPDIPSHFGERDLNARVNVKFF